MLRLRCGLIPRMQLTSLYPVLATLAPVSNRKPKRTNEDLYRFYLALEVLRTKEREFPAQLASTFLFVCSHNGCRQEDSIEATSMSSSSVSRNVQWLGPRHRLGKDGLHLIYRERDPDDPKRYRIYLTRKGEQLARLIAEQLNTPL